MKYDVIVIGGGPSGLMASIAASRNGAKVLLLDKGDKLGRKLAISGGGRCNVTNNGDVDHIIQHIPGNGKFLYSAFHTFSNRDIITFFEDLGISLKEEDNGRMFPVSDEAKTVVDTLIAEVRRLGVKIKVHTPVQQLLIREERLQGVVLINGETILADNVILAAGGKSVPHTGSTGDGYAWAEQAGHTITTLYPTEVPITSNEKFIQQKQCQGLSLRNVILTVWNEKNKKIISHQGDMIFTHFGISGPAVLRCSQFVVKQLQKNKVNTTVTITIDLLPEQKIQQIQQMLLSKGNENPNKLLKNTLKSFIPERIVPAILDKLDINHERCNYDISNILWEKIAMQIKAFNIQVNGTLPIEKAFVTGGGVKLKEIDPKCMQSKLLQGLFFCGEILDIHGYTGGYNITAAFATGFTAGKNAALLGSNIG
ncbi:NAD(P)/FAD-dependent oxidoreductase [Longirhabdus pacifica]|uniref:NAD(P)/FAD-dependent oxidoreductase n=1 Tax=Longirhabdus pacifica TaxID=2305227 RepID=UPI0010087291|nr:NAD(P)/FAD-dependent oxidoreductase [Longirhabdus pacifica]